MKSQIEKIQEAAENAFNYFLTNFNKGDFSKDSRLLELRHLLMLAARALPEYSTAELAIEYNKSTGSPKVNEELAQRHINQLIEKAVFKAEPGIELDILDSNRDDVLIARLKGTYHQSDREHPNIADPNEAKAVLENRLEMYRLAAAKIAHALET